MLFEYTCVYVVKESCSRNETFSISTLLKQIMHCSVFIAMEDCTCLESELLCYIRWVKQFHIAPKILNVQNHLKS